MLRATLLTGAAWVLAACTNTAAQVGRPVVPKAPTATAAATLVDPSGQAGGRALLTATGNGIEVRVNVQGLTPGPHGIHLHAIGRCVTGPDPSGREVSFGGAGGHFDPGGSQHHGQPGQVPQRGHAGDMPNVMVAADGTGELRFVHPHLTLGTDAATALGRAIVVHEKADDYRSQPAGDSGGRVLCGVIEAARPTEPKSNQG